MTQDQAEALGDVLEALELWLMQIVRPSDSKRRDTARDNLIDAVDDWLAAMEGE